MRNRRADTAASRQAQYELSAYHRAFALQCGILSNGPTGLIYCISAELPQAYLWGADRTSAGPPLAHARTHRLARPNGW